MRILQLTTYSFAGHDILDAQEVYDMAHAPRPIFLTEEAAKDAARDDLLENLSFYHEQEDLGPAPNPTMEWEEQDGVLTMNYDIEEGDVKWSARIYFIHTPD